jgi:hypothetical protein
MFEDDAPLFCAHFSGNVQTTARGLKNAKLVEIMQNCRAPSEMSSRMAMTDRLMVPGQGRSKSARRQAKLDWLPATARGLKMQNWSILSKISKKYLHFL